jgi:hypothetical protein
MANKSDGWRLARAALVACMATVALAAGGEPAGAASGRAAPVQPLGAANPSAPGIAIAAAKFDLPDPFLLHAGRTYFLYVSTAWDNNTQNVPVLTGEPGHWSDKSVDAVPDLPPWAAGDPVGANEPTWSPAVYKLDGRFVMYFAPLIRGSDPPQHCIAIGTSENPAGPFHVSPQPFICQPTLGGDIDPQLFVDPNGPDGPSRPNYLVWKSDNNSTPGDGVTTIWAQSVSNDGTGRRGVPVSIFQPDQRWQMPLVEAPQMALSPNGAVWLFFSAGQGFWSPDYGIGAVRCYSPLGPCADPLPGPLITSNAQGAGPGEETYFIGPDGSDWLLYSPVRTGDITALHRPVEAARIGWNGADPFVANAGVFPPAG